MELMGFAGRPYVDAMIQGFREPPGKIISTDRRCSVHAFCNFCLVTDGTLFNNMFACNGCDEKFSISVFKFVDWYVIKRNRDGLLENNK